MGRLSYRVLVLAFSWVFFVPLSFLFFIIVPSFRSCDRECAAPLQPAQGGPPPVRMQPPGAQKNRLARDERRAPIGRRVVRLRQDGQWRPRCSYQVGRARLSCERMVPVSPKPAVGELGEKSCHLFFLLLRCVSVTDGPSGLFGPGSRWLWKEAQWDQVTVMPPW